MSLMTCPRCGRPRLAEGEVCPRCGEGAPEESRESPANLACLVLMMLFVMLLILLPVLLLAGIMFR